MSLPIDNTMSIKDHFKVSNYKELKIEIEKCYALKLPQFLWEW